MNVPVPEYGAVPPVAETVTEVVPSLQAIEPVEEEATNVVGSSTEPEVTEVQPLASVTVYE